MDNIEILSLSFILNGHIFNLICIYRPPSNSIESFNDILVNTILPQIANTKAILVGDFNIDLLKPCNLNVINTFIHSMAGHNFYSPIDKPTRFSYNHNDQRSIIDHIWLNFNPHNDIKSSVLEFEVSDHRPIFFHFNTSIDENNDFIFYRNFSKTISTTNFVRDFNETDFNIFNTNDSNILATKLTKDIYRLFNKHLPTKRKKIANSFNRSQWLTSDLKILIKKKHKLLQMANRNLILKRSYTYFRNLLTTVLRKSKQLFYQTRLTNASKDSKETWKQKMF